MKRDKKRRGLNNRFRQNMEENESNEGISPPDSTVTPAQTEATYHTICDIFGGLFGGVFAKNGSHQKQSDIGVSVTEQDLYDGDKQ